MWTPAEDRALHELPWMAQLLYLRGLRRHMDGATGIVGRTRTVTRRMLIELLTVPDMRGRHSEHEQAPTESALRNALRALQRAGLVEALAHEERRLIFRLPLAMSGQSVSRMSDRRSDRMSDRPWMPQERDSGADFGMSLDGMSDPVSDRMSDRTSIELSLGNSQSAERLSSRAEAVRELCTRLRDEVGMHDASPFRADVIALVAEVGSVSRIVATAKQLRDRPGAVGPPRIGYLIATVRGRISDANGRGDGSGNAGSGRRGGSVCDQIERLERALEDDGWDERVAVH